MFDLACIAHLLGTNPFDSSFACEASQNSISTAALPLAHQQRLLSFLPYHTHPFCLVALVVFLFPPFEPALLLSCSHPRPILFCFVQPLLPCRRQKNNLPHPLALPPPVFASVPELFALALPRRREQQRSQHITRDPTNLTSGISQSTLQNV